MNIYIGLSLMHTFNDMSFNHPCSSSDWCLKCFQTLGTAALFLSVTGGPVLCVSVCVLAYICIPSRCVFVCVDS